MIRHLLLVPLVFGAGSALAQSGFDITDRNSIFSERRGESTTRPEGGTGPIVGPTTTLANLPAPWFVGAIRENGVVTGFLEIPGERGTQIITIHEGDRLAWNNSQVLAISLDALQLSTAATTRRIPLGYNLQNQSRLTPPATRATPPVSRAGPGATRRSPTRGATRP